MFLIDFLQRSWHANEVVVLAVEQNTFRQKENESHFYHPLCLSAETRERHTHTHGTKIECKGKWVKAIGNLS